MIFYRPHRGGLKEAMGESKIFNTVNEMIEHIVSSYNSYAIKPIIKDNVSLKLYSDRPDTRIGWKRTYVVLTNGVPDGFFTDEYEKNWEEIYNEFVEKNMNNTPIQINSVEDWTQILNKAINNNKIELQAEMEKREAEKRTAGIQVLRELMKEADNDNNK